VNRRDLVARRDDKGVPVTSPPFSDAILTRDEVADWLKVRPRQLERLGVPCLELGHKTKRYLVKDVQEWLEAQRRLHRRAA
jgi:hypothetical protein